MEALLDNLPQLLEGFLRTIELTALAAIGALVLGTLLAAMRVSPVPSLRLAGAAYVNTVRNTPLVIVFAFVFFALPRLEIRFSFFQFAVLALSVYTAGFVCEAVRSGVNAIPTGQAEAARAVGMTFGQSLTTVVLPQAFRTVVPPLGNILIALTKNTSIAAAFAGVEATAVFDDLVRDNPDAIYALFFGVAAGYVLIVLAISGVFRLIERRVVVLR